MDIQFCFWQGGWITNPALQRCRVKKTAKGVSARALCNRAVVWRLAFVPHLLRCRYAIVLHYTVLHCSVSIYARWISMSFYFLKSWGTTVILAALGSGWRSSDVCGRPCGRGCLRALAGCCDISSEPGFSWGERGDAPKKVAMAAGVSMLPWGELTSMWKIHCERWLVY